MNQLKGRDSDLSGLLVQEVLTGAEFLELLDRQRRRVAGANQPAVAFSEDDPLGDLRALRTVQAERLAERGLATFLDAERTAWKYTPRGAALIAIRPYLKQHRVILGRDGGREVLTWPEPGGIVIVPAERPAPARSGLLNKVEFFFWILLGVGAVLTFSRGPAVNRAQALFRAAVSAFGLVGIAIVWILKRRAASRAKERDGARWAERVGTAMQQKEFQRGTWAEDDSPDRA
jgi:hypothetical protein